MTSSHAGSPCPAPSRENPLVLYFEGEAAMDDAVERLAGFGHVPVDAELPLLGEDGCAHEDPDGWRLVLAPRPVVL